MLSAESFFFAMWSFLANFCPILLKEEGEAYNLR
jgi:hypothetical protein